MGTLVVVSVLDFVKIVKGHGETSLRGWELNAERVHW